MFDITLIAMGKLKEPFYLSAAAEYAKRLGGYCKFTLLELPEARLPENPSPAEIAAGLEKEADLIFSKIPRGAWFCVLTPEGRPLSSEQLADTLRDVKNSGKSAACFLIGSSFGMDPGLKAAAEAYEQTEKKGKTAPSFQFMRLGYFCLDSKDSTPENLVFNRSVSLKDSFKK